MQEEIVKCRQRNLIRSDSLDFSTHVKTLQIKFILFALTASLYLFSEIILDI